MIIWLSKTKKVVSTWGNRVRPRSKNPGYAYEVSK